MRIPHFLTLAQVDRLHFIAACRSGVVHLTWARATLRLDRDEFRRLVWLLERAADSPPPTSLRDGELCVTRRRDGSSEFWLGPAGLQFSPAEFRQFALVAREALHRLDRILASGAWEQADEEEGPPDTLDQVGRVPFSKN